MKKIIPLIFLLMLCVESNAQYIFQKIYGNSSINYLRDMEYIWDGGYYVLANTYSSGLQTSILVKINQSGQQIWTKKYSSPTGNWSNAIIHTADSGLLMTGKIGFAGNSSAVHLSKLDSAGSWHWTKIYGDPTGIAIGGVKTIMDYDGNYIIVGSSVNWSNGNSAIFLIKVNSVGDTIFTRKLGNPYYTDVSDIIQTQDSSYLITGSYRTLSPSGTMYVEKLYLVKFSKNGQLHFARTYVEP